MSAQRQYNPRSPRTVAIRLGQPTPSLVLLEYKAPPPEKKHRTMPGSRYRTVQRHIWNFVWQDGKIIKANKG